jgi:hypothetical protein
MRKINLTELLRDIVLGSHREQKGVGVPIYLTLPPNLPAIIWKDNSIELLIFNLLNYAIFGEPLERPIRVAVAERKTLTDLEALLDVHPSYWIELRMDMQSVSELDGTIKTRMRNFGFSAGNEWVVEGSPYKLVAYSKMNETDPRLFCWIAHNRARHSYTILIPVAVE